MTKRDKLFDRFMTKPARKYLTFSELESLLSTLGYERREGSGSRVKFFNPATKDLILIHKPHPGDVLKLCQIKDIQKKLKEIINTHKGVVYE